MTEPLHLQYSDYYKYFFKWVEEGHFRVDYQKEHLDVDMWGPADALFINLLGFGPITYERSMPFSILENARLRIEDALQYKKLNLSWITGPHGLALMKALEIRHKALTDDTL